MGYAEISSYQGRLDCDGPGCDEQLAVPLNEAISITDSNLSRWLLLSFMGIVQLSVYAQPTPDMPRFDLKRVRGVFCWRCGRVLMDALLEKGLLKPPAAKETKLGQPANPPEARHPKKPLAGEE